MTEQTWIHVPEGEGDGAWTGRVWSEGDQSRRWMFEAIRRWGGRSLYDQGVFEGARPVTVLLDLQRPATLIRPIVTRVDPGKAGMKHPFMRTRIEGVFQALLAGRAVEDEREPAFSGVGFESQAFAAWYGRRLFSDTVDDEYRPKSIDLGQPQTEVVTVPGIGELQATRVPWVKSDHAVSEVGTRTTLRITFERLLSLGEAMDLCLGLELVFGFLVGFRPPPPTFHLWWPTAPGSDVETMDAELELGGVHHRAGDAPHPYLRMHQAGRDTTGLLQVATAYARDGETITSRIHAVQVGRWFGRTLNDKFASVMPVFEQYVQNAFKSGEERSYLTAKSAFFDHVETSADPDVIEFCRKHVAVKDQKSPSLATLIGRAFERLNAVGFCFDPDLAPRISKRRAAMFHTAPLMSDSDVQAFSLETQAVTAALMLLTLADFGVDIGQLAQAYHALADFSQFMPQPKSSAEKLAEELASQLGDVE